MHCMEPGEDMLAQVRRGVAEHCVLALLTTGPAQALGLKRQGSLAPGSPASLVLFDPAEKWVFRAADSRSKSKNTPFDGSEL